MVVSLPIGYEFDPTKSELVGFFLATRLRDHRLPPCYRQFLDYNIYGDHPFNILASTKLRRGVQEEYGRSLTEGYFFTELTKISAKGKRKIRVVENHGTWVEKAATKKVYDKTGMAIGVDKYYKFSPVAEAKNNSLNKDEWTMHEYSLLGRNQDIVLCHITRKKVLSKKDKLNDNMVMESSYEVGPNKRSRVDMTYSDESGPSSRTQVAPNSQGVALSEQSSFARCFTDQDQAWLNNMESFLMAN